MPNIQKSINKVSNALRVKGIMPLLDTSQFIGSEGTPVTKYELHYGYVNVIDKNGKLKRKKDVVASCYGKAELLRNLIEILKAGDG